MDIKYYKNAADFLAHTGKYLAKDEARYGLIMGLARVVENNPHRYGKEDPWFCSIGTDNDIYAAAIRTPPYNVLVAYFSGNLNDIAEGLLKAVSRSFQIIPGVIGDKELADVFAVKWCDTYGVKIKEKMEQRVYRLVKVNDVPLASGKMRPATEADKELVVKWMHAFNIDCFGPDRNVPESDPTPGIEHGWVFLWELDGKPVSMALKSRPTDNGMTVGGVYTPPELRGKGYATSCVAELSRNILQSGKEFCMLYTDLANPTSNSIYKKIGYNEVTDSVEYTFYLPEVTE